VAKTFRLSNAASDLSIGGDFTHVLQDSAVGTDTVNATNSGGVDSGYYATGAGVYDFAGLPNTGTFTAVLNVSTAAAGTNARCYLQRVNSSGVQQAEVVSPTGYLSTATTGDKTWTWTDPALGTWAAGDRLVLRVEVQNTNAHGGAVGPTWDNTAANTRLDTPYVIPVTSTHTVDAIVRATLQRTHTVDAVVQTTPSLTHTVDAHVEVGGGGTVEKTHTVDSYVVCLPQVTGLTVTPASPTQLNLSWNAVTGADGYDIERDNVVIKTGHHTNSYSDTGLAPATQYAYRVRAVQT
jgi:hypothetical protein